jgi:hypothetical protein
MWLWTFYICMILSLIMQAASRSHTNSKKSQCSQHMISQKT